MGVVFAAYDRERDSEVALKILQRLDPQGIVQIKREFRALAEVSHPNLVGLYELVSSGNAWFFTMELIDGVDFLSYVLGGAIREVPRPHGISSAKEAQTVRLIPELDGQDVLQGQPGPAPAGGSPPPPEVPLVLDVERLRSVLRQLVEGVCSIHAAHKVHRDIKPTNVLVSTAGRAVLLDFGLVSHGVPVAGGDDPGVSTTGGTPEYMAPEQVLGTGGDAASDWYAVGCMLYEALVQRLPFEGSVGQILKQKLSQDAPDIRGRTPPGTEDLADLAMRLLARSPADRPSTSEVMRAAGARGDGALFASSMVGNIPVEDVASAGVGSAFVGRVEQLAALEAAWRAHADAARRAVAVTITGRSGMGKSALCRRFLARVRADRPDAVVLEARCYERESVPHKALDGVVDALVGEIAALPGPARDSMPWADIDALGRLFPSARRLARELSGDVSLLGGDGDDGDGQEGAPNEADARGQRRQAAEALRRLLGRFAQRRPLVIHIDDFQWSDVDSLPLLSRPLSGVACPAVLWLFSYRAEEAAHSEPITGLSAILSMAGPAVDVRRVAVDPLTAEESSALALQLLGRADGLARARAERLAQESSGSPLFVAELARLERERGDDSQAAGAQRPATLEELLKVRVAALPVTARRLLERVAVAGRPTRQGAIRRAAGLGADDFTALLALRNGNLVRASGVQDDDVVEAYHDRIRELVASTLAPQEARRCHADLAAALQAGVDVDRLPSAELEALAHHSLNAGDDEGALRFTLRVARGARDVYASRDAARHFTIALGLLARRDDAELLRTVRREAAEAYRQAGLYDQALSLLTVMLQAAADGERAELFVDRGHVYQEKGDFQSAIADLESALELFGRKPPRHRGRLALAVGGELARHLLFSSRPARAAAAPGNTALERQAEVLILLVRIYYFVDIGKLVWAGVAAMNLARRSRREVTRVLATGYFGAILSGVGMLGRAARHCQRAVAQAERSGSGLALGVSLGRLGTVAIFRNELERAMELLHRSVAALKPVSEVWELLTNLMLEATAHFLAGQLEPAQRLWEEMSVLAHDAGGAMHVAWSQAWMPYVRYLRGTVGAAEARRELSAALEASRVVRDVANQTAAQAHLAALGVDERDGPAAADAAEALFETLRRYRVQVPFLQVGMVDAAEAALVALESGGEHLDPARRRRLRRIVSGALARLAGAARRYPMLLGPTLRVRARALAFAGRHQQARKAVARAVEVLERSPNRLWLFQACRDAARLLEAERPAYQRRAAELGASLALDARHWSPTAAGEL